MEFSRFSNIPIVDAHIHFSHPQRADDILTIMETVPLLRANLVTTPNLEVINHNPALIDFKARHPGRAYISGALDYTQVLADRDRAPGILAAQVARLKAIGFDGLKLIEGKPTSRKRIPIPLDAPEYEDMWAALEETRLPLLFHVADPEEFWDEERCPSWARAYGWFYADGSFPSKGALYAEVDSVLARHPRLKIVFAHFYFLSADLERASRFLDAHPDVCLDLTPGVEMYNNFSRTHDATRDFFIRYQDRLVFGTDISSGALQRDERGIADSLAISWIVRAFLERSDTFTMPEGKEGWLDPDLEGYRGLALPEAILHKIYHANFERVFGATPASLDREAALAELARMASALDVLAGAETGPNEPRWVMERLRAPGE